MIIVLSWIIIVRFLNNVNKRSAHTCIYVYKNAYRDILACIDIRTTHKCINSRMYTHTFSLNIRTNISKWRPLISLQNVEKDKSKSHVPTKQKIRQTSKITEILTYLRYKTTLDYRGETNNLINYGTSTQMITMAIETLIRLRRHHHLRYRASRDYHSKWNIFHNYGT